jgi:hypothetical protein
MFALEIEFPPLEFYTNTILYHFSQQIHFFLLRNGKRRESEILKCESRFLLIKFILNYCQETAIVLMYAVIHCCAAVPILSALPLIDKENSPRKCFVINRYSKELPLMQEWNMFILLVTLDGRHFVVCRKHTASLTNKKENH